MLRIQAEGVEGAKQGEPCISQSHGQRDVTGILSQTFDNLQETGTLRAGQEQCQVLHYLSEKSPHEQTNLERHAPRPSVANACRLNGRDTSLRRIACHLQMIRYALSSQRFWRRTFDVYLGPPVLPFVVLSTVHMICPGGIATPALEVAGRPEVEYLLVQFCGRHCALEICVSQFVISYLSKPDGGLLLSECASRRGLPASPHEVHHGPFACLHASRTVRPPQ